MKASVFAIAAVAAFAVQAEVKLSGPFADGAVLQRGMRVPVWGTAAPGEGVRVSFAGQTVEARANANGKWRVDLAPMEACRSLMDSKISLMLGGEGRSCRRGLDLIWAEQHGAPAGWWQSAFPRCEGLNARAADEQASRPLLPPIGLLVLRESVRKVP